jgi:SAM-dependent methyltransferase
MSVLEPGPGMGFFTLDLARLVGPSGRVVAVDVEPRMLARLERRARRAGLLDRIDARVVPPTSMRLDDLTASIDFGFAFAVVHEMPAAAPFFAEVARALKPGAALFLAEPAGHVSDGEFSAEVAAAARAGFADECRPPLRGSHTAVLRKRAVVP